MRCCDLLGVSVFAGGTTAKAELKNYRCSITLHSPLAPRTDELGLTKKSCCMLYVCNCLPVAPLDLNNFIQG